MDKMTPMTADEFPQEVHSSLGHVYRLSHPPQGCTSDSATVESERGVYVVKRSRGSQFSDWLAQEHRVLAALASSPLPVPRPHQFVRRRSPLGPESWLVMDYLPGESLHMALQANLDPGVRAHLLRTLGKTLAAIHATPVPPELAQDEMAWLDRMLDLAGYNLTHYRVDGSPELLERLRRERPAPLPATLIHGDFTLDNVLIADDEVSGIIDWSGGACGDPRYDVALAIRPEPEAFHAETDIQVFFEGYGRPPLSDDEVRYFVGLYEFF